MQMNFSRVLRHHALRHRDRDALVNVERGRRLDFMAYHRLTNRIANALREGLGIARGDRFLLILENDNLSLFQLPLLLKQPGAAVYTNLRDPPAEHARQIAFIRPKAVVIETRLLPDYLEMLRASGCAIVAMDRPAEPTPDVVCFQDLIEAASDAENEVTIDIHRDPVLIRFTGGTTGVGKAAVYTADNLLAVRDSALTEPTCDFSADTRLVTATPLSHASQLGFIATFFAGGTNVTLNQVDLERWRATVEAERVTHGLLVPTLLYRLLELQQAAPRDLSTLRTLLYGASPMSPAKLADLVACFGPIFVQVYAATEAPMFLTVLDKESHRLDSEAARRRLASAGRVTSGVDLSVLGENGRECAPGEVGEIVVRCRAVIGGYDQAPEVTAAEFVEGAWRSGDLGYVDEDGYVFIVDRAKDMIISGGFNVYAVEVEAALSAHPEVLMAAAVGVPHAEWGEAVHAEVVLRAEAAVTAEALIEHVKARIGAYKAPKTVTFVDALPTSAVGKVLRRAVREKYWAGRTRAIG